MRGGRKRRNAPTRHGLLALVVVVLLVAPALCVVAALSLAGPSTRAILARSALADHEDAADPRPAPGSTSPLGGRAEGAPLAVTGASDRTSGPSGLARLFEPRSGRFEAAREAGAGADGPGGHEHDADSALSGDDGMGVAAQGQDAVTAQPARTADAQVAPTPAPTPWPAGPPRPFGDLPIVMFHYTGPLPPNPDVFRRDLTVSPALLESELQYLADNGIETVALDRLFEHLEGRQPLPAKAVVLTFDDGYADNYEYAFPLLKRYGMVGTFFIPTGLVGRPGYMTWEQIEEMGAAGMSMEAHTITHADLTKIAPAQLARELAEPRRLLEEHLGRPCRFLAYPSGRFDTTVIRATKAAGYTAAVSTQHGTRHTADGPYELTRVRARGTEVVAELVSKLTPASWRSSARQP